MKCSEDLLNNNLIDEKTIGRLSSELERSQT